MYEAVKIFGLKKYIYFMYETVVRYSDLKEKSSCMKLLRYSDLKKKIFMYETVKIFRFKKHIYIQVLHVRNCC